MTGAQPIMYDHLLGDNVSGADHVAGCKSVRIRPVVGFAFSKDDRIS